MSVVSADNVHATATGARQTDLEARRAGRQGELAQRSIYPNRGPMTPLWKLPVHTN